MSCSPTWVAERSPPRRVIRCPWCEAGASFLIRQRPDVDKVLDRALDSVEARSGVMQAFDRYFRVSEEGAPMLINLLYNQGLL